MSVINKKPFIKSVLDSLSNENLVTLRTLINGGGNQVAINRTMSNQPKASRPNITTADKGVKLCNLQLETSLYNGYLIYNNDYCVLVHFTDSPVLSMFDINVATRSLATVAEALDVNELRSELTNRLKADLVDGKVPASQLPSYVDDIVEGYYDDGKFYSDEEHAHEIEGEEGKIYVDLNTEFTYRWSGTIFVQVNADPVVTDTNGNLVVNDVPVGAIPVEKITDKNGNKVEISTYKTFPNDWTTNGTIAQFCASVNADANAVAGLVYLGELTCSDLPFNGNADAQVEIIDGTGTSGKVIHIVITSGNVAPYRWEYTYWNDGTNTSGWITFGGDIVTLNSTSGTLSDGDYDKIASDKCLIKYDSYIYYKINETSSYIYYQRTAEVTSVSTYAGTVDRYVITITKSNKAYSLSSSSVSLNRVIANPVLSGSEQELEGINVGGTSFKNRAKVTANPTLVGSEAELTGLEIGNTKFKMPELVKLDGVKFAFDNNADYTLSSLTNFASYARVAGSMMIFVVSFDITKNNAVTAPITVGKFFGLSDELFAKLVGGTYLVEENTKAYVDGSFTSVDAATALQKTTVSGVNYISLLLDTANLVQGTTYHVRHMSTFLLTDNIGGIDSVLSNNSWDIIEEVASLGQTANYWNVGDTKTDLGTDGNTRTFRIIEIENDGSIVFEQVELEATALVWNPSTNLDSDNA